jgi:signal transduction histidine kinase
LALIPQWDVTLIWPPSGVALAAVLLGGRQSLPGIFLGAFVTTLTQLPSTMTPLFLCVGLAIPAASTLSALVAGEMLKRIAPQVPHASSGAELLKGCIAIGLACTIAASGGVVSLSVSGLMPENLIATSWGLWWLGDFSGMLIFGPMSWLVAQFWKEHRSEFRPGPLVPAIALNSTFAATAVLAFMMLWNSETNKVSQSLVRESTAAANSVRQILRASESSMEGVRSFLYASEYVSTDEFGRYAGREFSNQKFDLLTQGVGWIPRVTNPETWETQMHNELLLGVRLHEIDNSGKHIPVAQRDEYFPVQYVQPNTGITRRIIGLDLCAEKTRCTALEIARDTGQLKILAPFFPAQLDEPLLGILLAVPVYRPDMILDTVATRRANLTGFAVGVYFIGRLFDEALLEANIDIDVHLFDEAMPIASQWYHTRASPYRAHAEDATPTLADLQKGLNGASRIRFANLNWLVVATPGQTYVQSHRTWTPWAALVLMLALGIALSSILIERVTARKIVDEERQKTEKALKKALVANESKSYFMAAASHDIKQPLYALGILTDTLLMSDPDKSAVPVLKGLRISIDEMSEHFDTLMDFGKFQDGSFDVQPVAFRLGAFSERLDFEIAPLCSSKGLTWNIDMDDVTVWTDQELFLRLCRNLLTNAVSYTHSGEVCCYAKANADAVEFLISDTGIGIAEETQKLVFKRFLQLEHSGIGAAGTGLGLSIVKKIDEALHLDLQMSSVIGKGTEFRFRLLRVSPK